MSSLRASTPPIGRASRWSGDSSVVVGEVSSVGKSSSLASSVVKVIGVSSRANFQLWYGRLIGEVYTVKSKYRLTSGCPIFLSHVVKVFNDYIGDRENSKMIRREWFSCM